MFDKKTQDGTEKCHLSHSSTPDPGSAMQCTCMPPLSNRCHVSNGWCLKPNWTVFDNDTLSSDSLAMLNSCFHQRRSKGIALMSMRHPFNWSCGARRIHLADVSVVAMAMTNSSYTRVEADCNTVAANVRRSAVMNQKTLRDETRLWKVRLESKGLHLIDWGENALR